MGLKSFSVTPLYWCLLCGIIANAMMTPVSLLQSNFDLCCRSLNTPGLQLHLPLAVYSISSLISDYSYDDISYISLNHEVDMTIPSLAAGMLAVAFIAGAAFISKKEAPVDLQKKFQFDEISTTLNYKTTPIYLLSAVLSGLNELPDEVNLLSGSQRGRRVQYARYQAIAPNWKPLLPLSDTTIKYSLFSSAFSVSLDRIIDSPAVSLGEQQVGTLRMYKFHLKPADILDIKQGIMSQLKGLDAIKDGIQVSNAGGFHSVTDLFQREDGPDLLRALCTEAVSIAEENDYNAGGGKDTTIREFQASADSESWLNSNNHGCWNSLHTHFGSAWSGIYYVQTAEECALCAYSGNLLIKPSPHISEIKQLNSVETSRLNIGPRDNIDISCCDYLQILPEAGMMLVFPSYLQHAVLPLCIKEQYRQEDAGNRVSFAFNFAEKI